MQDLSLPILSLVSSEAELEEVDSAPKSQSWGQAGPRENMSPAQLNAEDQVMGTCQEEASAPFPLRDE